MNVCRSVRSSVRCGIPFRSTSPYLADMMTKPIGSTLFGWIVPLCGMAITGCSGESRVYVTMAELADYTYVPVTIEGDTIRAYMTDDSVHYSEWAYGPFRTDQPIELESVFQSRDSFLVVTPYGTLPIDVLSIRLFLHPYFSRTYGPENASTAPLAVERLVENIGATVSVQEFLLQPGITYFARVGVDSVAGVDGGPTRKRYLLEIASRPFDAPRLPPATPATR